MNSAYGGYNRAIKLLARRTQRRRIVARFKVWQPVIAVLATIVK